VASDLILFDVTDSVYSGDQSLGGWLVWCVLLLFVLGAKHPPTMDDYLPLDPGRKLIGWIALICLF